MSGAIAAFLAEVQARRYVDDGMRERAGKLAAELATKPADAAVEALCHRRCNLSHAKRQQESLAELCRRKLAEHEEAIAAIDRDIDVIDEQLFAAGAAGEVPRVRD